ncbi:MAG TPA: cytochrome d ubiquinol oxidase subunit II [Casimicrobiaceae bacterium]|nr:cytochrome d ubiquinol oxidase subunit II [Casimicrobiaceae bacterium]
MSELGSVFSELDFSLPVIWAVVIGVAVALYVVLDGFDLGVGILFPLLPSESDRDLMMNSVAPFWDGNETWLVLGGGGLWVAFPKAFAVIMPALYLPVILLLLALIFRGVAFEFRWVAKPNHRLWDVAFGGGSIVAAFAQGLVLGGLLQGITVRDGQFAGGTFDWLTPFSIVCGAALVTGYALIGATWLVMKTEGQLEDHARRLGKTLLIGTLAFIAAVSIWTPIAFPRIAERWFSMPDFLYLSQVPLATAIVTYGCWRGLAKGYGRQPFVCAVILFLLAFAGLVLSNVPYLVPPTITVWDAAASPKSQMFMLVGVLVLLPIILAYTAFNYWVFRGKLKEGEGYHH